MAEIFDSNFTSMEESLNQHVDRSLFVSIFLCILYLALMIFTIVANGAVVISSIFERWKEVDNFTFVIFVSLAFDHLFIGFIVFPLISYSMVAQSWGLGLLFCWWCALLSTYFYTVYIVHAVLLMLDLIIVRFSDLRTSISVSVSKRIALHLWLICGIPQIYPLRYIEHPYLYDPLRGGCYQSFLYSSPTMFFKTVGIFVVMPILLISISYFVLLVKEENRRRLTASILKRQSGLAKDLTITRNYITPCLATTAFLVTVSPYFVCGILKLCSIPIPSSVAEFANTWFCLGGVLLPGLYFLVVKTFRVCVFPNCKWGLHVAAITKLRHKTHSPCVRRQGVCHTIPVMAVTTASDSNSKVYSSNTLTIPVLEMPSLPPLPSFHTNNGSLAAQETPELSTHVAGIRGDRTKRELPRIPAKNGDGLMYLS